jgi:hypothetical protein
MSSEVFLNVPYFRHSKRRQVLLGSQPYTFNMSVKMQILFLLLLRAFPLALTPVDLGHKIAVWGRLIQHECI